MTGQQIGRQKEWKIFHQMTFKLRVPRPSHTQNDEVEQNYATKKSLPNRAEIVAQAALDRLLQRTENSQI